MRIVFAGSPRFALPALGRLVSMGEDVVCVVTQPDRPVGRKKLLSPTPVKERAQELGIPVYDFLKIRGHVRELKELNADIMITCAYGQILTEEVLKAFPGGVWNLHASLLPKFRGASPVQAAILAGEEYTGVTVMKTELELDSGGILLVKRIKTGDMTCGELTEKLSLVAADAAEEAICYLKSGAPQLLMQNEPAASYCKKITKKDCRLNFSLSAEELVRAIKAFSPQPAAYCMQGNLSLNILDAEVAGNGSAIAGARAGEILSADKRGITVACGQNSIRILSLQPAGGKAMSAADYVNGRKIKAGDVLD